MNTKGDTTVIYNGKKYKDVRSVKEVLLSLVKHYSKNGKL
jgi:hypothetical protein